MDRVCDFLTVINKELRRSRTDQLKKCMQTACGARLCVQVDEQCSSASRAEELGIIIITRWLNVNNYTGVQKLFFLSLFLKHKSTWCLRTEECGDKNIWPRPNPQVFKLNTLNHHCHWQWNLPSIMKHWVSSFGMFCQDFTAASFSFCCLWVSLSSVLSYVREKLIQLG